MLRIIISNSFFVIILIGIIGFSLIDNSYAQTNKADINYNSITHDSIVTWDFGTRDCYSKTDISLYYMQNGTETKADILTFFGTNFSPVYKMKGVTELDIINEDKNSISCKGKFTFNITDFEILENFSGMEFYTSFYEKVNGKPQIINEVGLYYSEYKTEIPYACTNSASKLYTDYHYDATKSKKTVSNGTLTCDYPTVSFDGVHKISYTPVNSINFVSYPTNHKFHEHAIPEFDSITNIVTIPYDITSLTPCYFHVKSTAQNPNGVYYNNIEVYSFTEITSNLSFTPKHRTDQPTPIPCKGIIKIDINDLLKFDSNGEIDLWMHFAKKKSVGLELVDRVVFTYEPSTIFSDSELYKWANGSLGNEMYYEKCGLYFINPDNYNKVTLPDGKTYKLDQVTKKYELIPNKICVNEAYAYNSLEKEKTKSNGSGCNDCTPPTLGLNKHFKRVVDYGFKFNDQAVQVEKWYTEFPKINATTGILNHALIKVFENQGITNMNLIQFCIGLEDKGDPLNDCETLIEIHLEINGTNTDSVGIKEIKIIDKDNLIDNDSIIGTPSVTKCTNDNSINENCVLIDLYYSYRDIPFNDMVVIQVSDKKHNSQTFHFNKGVHVTGEPLNEPPVTKLFNKKSNQQIDNLWLELTRTDKIKDIWIDQNGIQYHKVSDNRFDRITPYSIEPINDPIWHAMTRVNSNFSDMILVEQQKAVMIFNSSDIISYLDDSIPMSYSNKDTKHLDEELQQRINDEHIKAYDTMKSYYTSQELPKHEK